MNTFEKYPASAGIKWNQQVFPGDSVPPETHNLFCSKCLGTWTKGNLSVYFDGQVEPGHSDHESTYVDVWCECGHNRHGRIPTFHTWEELGYKRSYVVYERYENDGDSWVGEYPTLEEALDRCVGLNNVYIDMMFS